MIDTHAHLNWPDFANNIEEVVQESKQAGLTGIIIASSNINDSIISVELAKSYPSYLYAAVGIHPQQTDTENILSVRQQLGDLENIISPTRTLLVSLQGESLPSYHSQILAIGECGLDYSPAPPGEKNRTPADQELLFRGQIDLSIQYNLPLITHARQANDEVITILSDYPKSRGVFHCYSGGKKRIKKILDLSNDWYFGFDGNLTYDTGLQEVVKLIPQNRILIETDAPFLPPIPYRGQLNSPANLIYIQDTINLLFNKNITSSLITNSKKLFTI